MLDYGHAYFLGARGYFVDARPKFIDGWIERAKKKRFTMRNIVDDGARGHRITTFPFTQTRYNIPKEFSFLSVFWIYGDKVVISNYLKKEPIVIVIQNKQLFETYKRQFETLWTRKIL